MMYKKRSQFLVCAFAASFQAGCYTPTPAQTVSLKDALVSSVDAMYEANAEARRQMKKNKFKQGLGLAVCQLNAKFLIDVKNSSEDRLALSAGPAPAIPVPLTINASTTKTDSDERSNTITVLYTSKDCVKKAEGVPDPNKGSGD